MTDDADRDRLIAYLTGTSLPADDARLASDLRADPRLRRRLIDLCHDEMALRRIGRHATIPSAQRPWLWRPAVVAVAAAAMVGVVVGSWWLWHPAATPGDRWAWPDGTQVLAQGPATVTASDTAGDAHGIDLRSGTVSVTVPHAGGPHPFTVRTPHGRVTVTGTRFQVATSRDRTDVAVWAGTVVAIPDHGSDRQNLSAGSIGSFGPGGILAGPRWPGIEMGPLGSSALAVIGDVWGGARAEVTPRDPAGADPDAITVRTSGTRGVAALTLRPQTPWHLMPSRALEVTVTASREAHLHLELLGDADPAIPGSWERFVALAPVSDTVRQTIVVPWTAFSRRDWQPPGAPAAGLGLDRLQGVVLSLQTPPGWTLTVHRLRAVDPPGPGTLPGDSSF